jgi:moderate conductance mechanosensitive channel
MARTSACLGALLLIILVSAQADAQVANTGSSLPGDGASLTPDQARQLLGVLEDDSRRGQLIQTLRGIVSAPPAQQQRPTIQSGGVQPAPSQQARSSPPQPASAPQAPAPSPAKPRPSVQLNGDSLGAQLLMEAAGWVTGQSAAFETFFRRASHFGHMRRWVVEQATDPATVDKLWEISWRLVAVLACSLVVEQLIGMGSRRIRASFVAHLQTAAASGARRPYSAEGRETRTEGLRPAQLRLAWQSLMRLPWVLGRLTLDLLPIIAFAAVSNLLAGTKLSEVDNSRLIILAISNAYVICRTIMSVLRALIASPRNGPSVLTVEDKTATYLENWARRIVVVAVFGLALADTALLLGLYRPSYDALVNLVALVVHLFVAIVVVQCRRPVAAAIRTSPRSRSVLAWIRDRLANVWHLIAICLDLAVWAVWAFKIPHGYIFLLRASLDRCRAGRGMAAFAGGVGRP